MCVHMWVSFSNLLSCQCSCLFGLSSAIFNCRGICNVRNCSRILTVYCPCMRRLDVPPTTCFVTHPKGSMNIVA